MMIGAAGRFGSPLVFVGPVMGWSASRVGQSSVAHVGLNVRRFARRLGRLEHSADGAWDVLSLRHGKRQGWENR